MKGTASWWFLLLTTAFLVIVASGCGTVDRAACPPLEEPDRARLQLYVQKKFELPVPPELTETGVVSPGCYRQLGFAADSRRPPFHVTLYLSPDRR